MKAKLAAGKKAEGIPGMKDLTDEVDGVMEIAREATRTFALGKPGWSRQCARSRSCAAHERPGALARNGYLAPQLQDAG